MSGRAWYRTQRLPDHYGPQMALPICETRDFYQKLLHRIYDYAGQTSATANVLVFKYVYIFDACSSIDHNGISGSSFQMN